MTSAVDRTPGRNLAEDQAGGSPDEAARCEPGQQGDLQATVPLSTDPDLNPDRPLALVTTRPLLATWIWMHAIYLLGGAAGGTYLFAVPTSNAVLGSLLAAGSMAFAGASAYYLRRIYKAGIQGRLHIITKEEARQRRPRVMGTGLYILSRPPIAAVLSVFVAMTVAATWASLSPSGVSPTHGIVELASIYGFLVGFFSGRSISQLESSGKITP